MVKSSKGLKTGTRRIMKKDFGTKFKPERYLKEFKIGDRVVIKIDPTSKRGIPHSRFQGNIGDIQKKIGNAYMVKITNKNKALIVNPEHLVLVK